MHQLKVSALHNRERYYIILVHAHTLKHTKPAKCVINVLFLVKSALSVYCTLSDLMHSFQQLGKKSCEHAEMSIIMRVINLGGKAEVLIKLNTPCCLDSTAMPLPSNPSILTPAFVTSNTNAATTSDKS